MYKTIRTPEGTRDRLFAECAAFRHVEQAVTASFRRAGYCEMTTPNVEYYDLIAAAGYPLSQEAVLKSIDRSGRILVMRPDCTVAMGRAAATKLRGLPRPLRLYYNQMVFRSDDVNTGSRSEIDQCGAELIGTSGLRADLEVISLAISAMEACGLEDYHIEIGHAGYFGALVEALDVSEEFAAELRNLLECKTFTRYEELLAPCAGTPAGRALCNLPRLFGGAEVLKTARALCRDEKAAETLRYLEMLYEALSKAGFGARVRFDLGLVQTIEYYTGIVFRGYSHGASGNVLSGGRYDRLIGIFGENMPAAGFGLDVELVASCLPLPEHRQPETVVYYDLPFLGRALKIVGTFPPGTAMLSCADTADAAETEARGLGAGRLIFVTESGEREESL